MHNMMDGFMIPLTECRAGDAGVIVDVSGTCDTAKRLAEMGVHTGSQIRVMRAGSPMIVESGNSRLCLRAEMAQSVLMSLGAETYPMVDEIRAATEAS